MIVELLDHMGSDLTVVNAARVSFDKESEWEKLPDHMSHFDTHGKLSDKDANLIKFLARGLTTQDWDRFLTDLEDNILEWNYPELTELLWNFRRTPEHFVPFAHPHVTFRIKAPIFVARQLFKHKIGMVESEVSRRYVDEEPEFFVPEKWRKRADNVKQGSSDERVTEVYTRLGPWTIDIEDDYSAHIQTSIDRYRRYIAAGVCPEQARMVLPQSMMTEWIWTGSLYGWSNVFNKRKPGSHAQRECWPYAEAIGEHMSKLFPVSWEALTSVP
jgi:thymidylate synthase (FAD)